MANKATANTQPINKKAAPEPVQVKLVNQSGKYTIGMPRRPSITHDNGFLASFSPREPTLAERLAYAKLRVKARGGDLVGHYWNEKKKEWVYVADAISAYEHWLEGSGATRKINYRKFLTEDASGKRCLQYILDDFKRHAEVISENRTKFSITSDSYQVGGRGSPLPYPDTENWQKAIGAHPVWVSGTVEVSYDKKLDADIFQAQITLHAEDMYNFNPGMKDIATGKPDSDNGMFEVTGLAKQYLNVATEMFNISWQEQTPKDPFRALK